MATTAEVKAALDGISQMITSSTKLRAQAKNSLLVSRNQLASLPTQYADAISTIDAYTPTGAFETLSKDEKAKLQTEFLALKAALENELDALGVSYT